MPKSSTNDRKNAYQRVSFWLKKRETTPKNLLDRMDLLINNLPGEWTTRPKNWRKLNGFPK